MKKTLTLTLLMLLSIITYAQPKIGLIVAPGLSMNRPKYLSDVNETIEKESLTLRIKFGLEGDFHLTENYAINTGLVFAPKRISIRASDFNEATTSIVNQVEEYKINYIQLPASLKLFTSEIQPDMKLFFQLGFLLEILLSNEALEQDNVLIEKFKFYDFSFFGGVGVEYGAGINSILYGGIFYDRGLVNIVKDQHSDVTNELSVKMDYLSLRLGVKF